MDADGDYGSPTSSRRDMALQASVHRLCAETGHPHDRGQLGGLIQSRRRGPADLAPDDRAGCAARSGTQDMVFARRKINHVISRYPARPNQ
jgi:hypothetical protein